MKKLVGLLIAFAALGTSHGQNQLLVDSLLQLTKSNISDIVKVDALNQLSQEYGGLDSARSHTFGNEALEMATQSDYKIGRIDALYALSRNFLLIGAYDASARYIEQVITEASEVGYEKGLANGYFAKGWLRYYRGEYDESIDFHEKAYTIRSDLGNNLETSNSLRAIGIAFKLKGDFDHARYYLNESLTIEREEQNLAGIAESLNHIGIIYGLRGNNAAALECYYEALEHQKAIGENGGLAYTYQNIGVVHFQQAEYEKTLDYYNKSLELRREIGDTRGIGQITANIGDVFHRQGDFDKALAYYMEALKIKGQLGDQRGVADGYLNIGTLYTDQLDYTKAIGYQVNALEIFKKIDSDWGKVNALIGLGKSYYRNKNPLRARELLKQSIHLGTKARLTERIKEAARILAIVERELGNYQEAYEAQLLYQKLADSLSSEAVAREIALVEAEYRFKQVKDSIQFENKKQRLELDQKISEQRNIQIITFIAMVVLFSTIVILYRYYHLKNRSNKELTTLNNEIREANNSLTALNNEKNNLIGIVAHDLKNPLSGIINAAGLLATPEHKNETAQLKALIQDTSSRMFKMITEILNIEEIEKSAESIRLESYNLSPVVQEVSDQFTKTAAKKKIELVTSIEDEVHALVDQRFVIQVIENLISNAVKFSPLNKKVRVSLSKTYGPARLEIQDEGPGLSEKDKAKLFQRFQRLSAKPTGDESSTGLGLSIVKTFVENMNGKIWCESTLGKGATFIVELPRG